MLNATYFPVIQKRKKKRMRKKDETSMTKCQKIMNFSEDYAGVHCILSKYI